MLVSCNFSTIHAVRHWSDISLIKSLTRNEMLNFELKVLKMFNFFIGFSHNISLLDLVLDNFKNVPRPTDKKLRLIYVSFYCFERSKRIQNTTDNLYVAVYLQMSIRYMLPAVELFTITLVRYFKTKIL